MAHKVSQAGISLIKEFEGMRLQSYQDAVGVWTIGYGTTSADSGITGTKIGPGMLISKEQAESWLTISLNTKYGPKVNKYDNIYHWTQNEFDALISFAYNIGSIDELVNKGKLAKQKIPEIMLKYVHAGKKVLQGLVLRRKREVELFCKKGNSGSISQKPNDPFEGVPIGDFVLQKATKMNLENGDYKFMVGSGSDNQHVYCVRKNGNGKHRVEVHILDGRNDYNSFILQTTTCLDDAGNEFDFCLGVF